MSQIEKNKAELLNMIEQEACVSLSADSIRNLSTLYDAYKAVCMVGGETGRAEAVAMTPKDGRSKMMEHLEIAIGFADERFREDLRRFVQKLRDA